MVADCFEYVIFCLQAFMNFMPNFNDTSTTTAQSYTNKDYNERNFLLLNIYYGSLMESVVTESKSVDMSSLFSKCFTLPLHAISHAFCHKN